MDGSEGTGPRRRRAFWLIEVALVLGMFVVLMVPGTTQHTLIGVLPAHCSKSMPASPCQQTLRAVTSTCPSFGLSTNVSCTPSVAGHWAGEAALLCLLWVTTLAHASAHGRHAAASQRSRSPTGRPRLIALASAVLLAGLGSTVTYLAVDSYINSHDD